MIKLPKSDLLKRQPPLIPAGAVAGRQPPGRPGACGARTGPLHVEQTFSVSLSLDPLTNDPELVGREIRNHLDAVGVRERQCVVGLPLKWALTTHVEVPELPEADVAGFLQIEAERSFPCDVQTLHVVTSRPQHRGRQATRHAGRHSEEPPGAAGAGAAGGETQAGQLLAGHRGVAAARGRGLKRRDGADHWRKPRGAASHGWRRRGGAAGAGRRPRSRGQPAGAACRSGRARGPHHAGATAGGTARDRAAHPGLRPARPGPAVGG